MDNIAHTLAGLALAEAGLRRRTGLATAALAVGANLPDVDAFIYAVGSGVDALAFRRGWTHGVLAMILLPLLLAGAMLGWDRFVRQRRRSGAPRGVVGTGPVTAHVMGPEPVNFRWLLIVAAVGVWSHPLLDLLNTYGVRLLMPFSDRWFYGDTLFIVDPWLWGSLGVGIVLSRLRRRRGARGTLPARVAIGALAGYIAVMAASSQVARGIVERQADTPAERVMAAPTPVTPFSRAVVRDLDSLYEVGRFRWTLPPRYVPGSRVATGRAAHIVSAASGTADGAAYLSWSRFPRFTAVAGRDSTLIRITDMRYPDMDWASVEVMVPAGALPSPSPP